MQQQSTRIPTDKVLNGLKHHQIGFDFLGNRELKEPGNVAFATFTRVPLASSGPTRTSLQIAIPCPETAASMA